MKENNKRQELNIANEEFIPILFGKLDENLKYMEKSLDVKIIFRENKLMIYGDEFRTKLAVNLIDRLFYIIDQQKTLTKHDLKYTVELILQGKEENVKELLNEIICISASGKAIKPKTIGQKIYIDAMKNNDIVFGIGPAGTGKTYLAMAMAVNAFKKNQVNRIILTRPAVEAGESLGFLPGDLQDKVDPYLRPLYDALFDILGYETYLKLIDKGAIEVAPLAYMRGRTLDSSFIILDEAQNTTNEQMKMFLTRMGYGSKAIITGDITQVDLGKNKSSGLVTVSSILKNVKGLGFVYLNKNDIVRHPIVQRIIEAYEAHEGKQP